MPTLLPMLKRFALPALAAYLLHWGVWWMVHEGEQVLMSAFTAGLTWMSEVLPSLPRIERATWSAPIVAMEFLTWAVIPIGGGLLIGWCLLRRKRRLHAC